MKIQVLLTALALACGAAHAQGSADSKMATTTPQATGQAQASGEGLGAKTKRAFQRMGDATRNAMNRMKGNKDGSANAPAQASAQGGNPAGDTRTMGAAPSDTTDASRRQRMDQAYDNWKAGKK